MKKSTRNDGGGTAGIAPKAEQGFPFPKVTTDGTTALVALGGNLNLPPEIVSTLEMSESLAEIRPEDRMIGHESFNVRLKGKDDQWIPFNRFVNTVTEVVSEELDAVLLSLKKTRRFTEWDDDSGSTLKCYSRDLETGHWQDPPQFRQCQTCPFQRWTGDGRNSQPPKCKLVWNFVGINLQNGDPFIVSAKSTSEKAVKQFLNKHFIGKLQGKNLPLFCYQVRLKLQCPKRTYAVLEPEIVRAFEPAEIETWNRMARELSDSQRIDLTQTTAEDLDEKREDDLPF